MSNKKSRFVDRELWTSNIHFKKMKGWGQLLHIYMYLDLADFAGIAYLDHYTASHNTNNKEVMPESMDEIAQELKHFWVHYGQGLFICKNFITKTQTTRALRMDNPPHGAVIRDMFHWYTEGFEDIFTEVMKVNRTARFSPLSECAKELGSSKQQVEKKSESSKHGIKGRLDSFEQVLMAIDMMVPRQLLNTYNFDLDTLVTKPLGLMNEPDQPALEEKPKQVVEDDPLRPKMAPNQSIPLVQISQEKHDELIASGKYMTTTGYYQNPKSPFPPEDQDEEIDVSNLAQF